MVWQKVGADSWASYMVLITLVVSLGEVGARVGTRLQQFSDGKPLVQGQLEARHGHALACTHFTPGRCVHNWGIVRGTGPEVTAGPVSLPPPCRQIRRRRLPIIRLKENI